MDIKLAEKINTIFRMLLWKNKFSQDVGYFTYSRISH